jgi:hypothetical protein
LQTGARLQPLPASSVTNSNHFVDPVQDITDRHCPFAEFNLATPMRTNRFGDYRAHHKFRSPAFHLAITAANKLRPKLRPLLIARLAHDRRLRYLGFYIMSYLAQPALTPVFSPSLTIASRSF